MKALQRIIPILALALFLGPSIVAFSSSAIAGEDSYVLFSGLRGVYLQVMPVDSATATKGIDPSQVYKEADQQLRKAGIRLFSQQEFDKYKRSGRYPLARVDISVSINEVMVGDATLNINNIVLRVRQQAFLGRKPALSLFATTWERREINYSNSLDDVHQTLRDLLAEFITTYLSATPS